MAKHSSDNCLIVNLSNDYPQPDEQKAQRPLISAVHTSFSKTMSVYNNVIGSKTLRAKDSLEKMSEI